MVVTASSPTHAPNFYSHRTFRPARYDDPAIQVLLAEYLRELELRDDTLSDELATATIDETLGANAIPEDFMAPNGVFVGVWDNDELCGIGGVRCYDDGTQHAGEIKRMFLRPGARGKGLSRELLSLLEDVAAALGCRVARLDTRSSLNEARGLYATHGYRETGRYNDNPFAQHFFEKELFADEASFRRIAAWMGIAADQLPSASVDAQRRLRLAGSFNFRDVGGYIGGGGQVVRTSLVFRSDHLNALTDHDLREIRARNIAAVYDFRLDSERERQPSRFEGGWSPEVHVLSTSDTQALDSSVIDLVREALAGTRPMPEPSFWEDAYETVLAAGRPMFVAMLTGLANESKLPALFHCTGGKDRTGIATLLIHRLLDVDDDRIIDDFLATNLYRTPLRLLALRQGLLDAGIDPASAIPMVGVTRSGVTRALQLLDETYGGVHRYLLDGGIDPEVLVKLRFRLLGESSSGEVSSGNSSEK